MTSAPVRDPLADHLITPENAAFLFIDDRPSQLAGSARWIARSWSNNARPTQPKGDPR